MACGRSRLGEAAAVAAAEACITCKWERRRQWRRTKGVEHMEMGRLEIRRMEFL